MNRHSHILLNRQNYVVWPPLPPKDTPVFSLRPNPPGRPKLNNNRKESRRPDPIRAPPENQVDYSQFQNRLKGRKHYPKKKFNSRFAPFAPRNTTSFLIRAKKEGLMEMAKEELGVDGYGSMKGLIRLRSGSPEPDDIGVDKKLGHDVGRFEMVYPKSTVGDEQSSVLENRVDEQDSHLYELEEENLSMKDRIFVMERELCELRRRVEFLETDVGLAPVNVAEIINDVAGHEGSEKSVANGNGEYDDVRD